MNYPRITMVGPNEVRTDREAEKSFVVRMNVPVTGQVYRRAYEDETRAIEDHFEQVRLHRGGLDATDRKQLAESREAASQRAEVGQQPVVDERVESAEQPDRPERVVERKGPALPERVASVEQPESSERVVVPEQSGYHERAETVEQPENQKRAAPPKKPTVQKRPAQKQPLK